MKKRRRAGQRTGCAATCAVLLLALLWNLCASTALPARAQESYLAREDVARFRDRAVTTLAATGTGKGYWGMLVTDADTGEVVYALNADRYFMPASNVKLFTSTFALATLGPGFRIRTTIETMGVLDRNGRLSGDLVLVGRGDANLSNRVFPYAERAPRAGPPETILAELADQVAARGVRQIAGDVVADDTYFIVARFPPGWTVDDTVWSYGAAVSPIAINDNALTIEVAPGERAGAPLRYRIDPASHLYEVRNRASTTPAHTEAQLRLSRDPESRVFVLSGTLPVGAPPRDLSVGVTEPAENAADMLARLLEARGIRIEGHSRAVHAEIGAAVPAVAAGTSTVLAEHLSPPLLDDVRLTNKISQNLHAELMLRVAAREKGGAMTLDDAVKFAAQFYQSVGPAGDDVLLEDGSGLSRNDLVTSQSVVELLAYAARQPWGADFVATLPVAGEDGTLEGRMKGTSAAGRVHAKTGTFERVNSLAGYATSVRGERLIFSIFGNNIGVPNRGAIGAPNRDAAAILDALCVAMVEELGAIPQASAARPEVPQ
jgi:D-alanyl-D-alanine carboxypeptidase/D-alanyl-D-alanine-endopeptidase (penicillin-binding protein 4)